MSLVQCICPSWSMILIEFCTRLWHFLSFPWFQSKWNGIVLWRLSMVNMLNLSELTKNHQSRKTWKAIKWRWFFLQFLLSVLIHTQHKNKPNRITFATLLSDDKCFETINYITRENSRLSFFSLRLDTKHKHNVRDRKRCKRRNRMKSWKPSKKPVSLEKRRKKRVLLWL